MEGQEIDVTSSSSGALSHSSGSSGRTLILWLAVGLGIVAVVTWQFCESRSALHPIRVALREQLKSKNLPGYVRAGGEDVRKQLLRFYQDRRFGPAWVDGRGPLSRAKELTEQLSRAGEEGLSPLDYQLPRIKQLIQKTRGLPLGPPPDPRRLAELDVLLTHSFLSYAADLFTGRLDPRTLAADWHTRPRRVDWKAVSSSAFGSDVGHTLEKLDPAAPGFVRLRETLGRYVEILKAGGWPKVPGGPTLKRGSRGPRVLLLRRRLAVTGDLGAGASRSPRFDITLESAVRRFQARHGLEPTGVVGSEELAALNVPVQARIRQIALNMERWRWLPGELGDRYVVVNIPDFVLQLYEHGRPLLAMRVIVGKEYSRTPIFSDTLTYVVFNPYWNVPASIVAEELADSIRDDPGYLEAHHMRVFDGPGDDAREIDPGDLDWSALLTAGSGYSLRQDPGPQNPLGRIKFMFPNRFNVYLHDTPAGHLFDRRERGYSHGCIRIENPVELANYLLRDKPGWGAQGVAAAMDTSVNRWVSIPRPILVHILYWTAWVDERGAVQFRDDVYGIDALLARALYRRFNV